MVRKATQAELVVLTLFCVLALQISLFKSSMWIEQGLSYAKYCSVTIAGYDELLLQLPQLGRMDRDSFIKVRSIQFITVFASSL